MFFKSLESWRGLAALAVAVFHFAGDFRPADFGPFVRNSYLFVDFFFVLSGLVISAAYGDRLARPGEGAGFVLRRFGRLWPLHVVTFLAVLAWQLRKGGSPDFALITPDGLNALLTNTLMIHALGVNNRLTFNFPSWSISAEFWTCMVFLLVVRFGGRRTSWIGVALIAGCMALVLLLFHEGSDATYDYGFPRAIAGFFAGVLVHRLFLRLGERSPGGTAAEIAAIVLVFAFVMVAGKPTNIPGPVSLLAVLPLVAAPLVFAPAVLIFAKDAGALSAFLALAPFRFLGRISYSIYMVHALVVIVLPSALGHLTTRTGVDWTQKTLGAEAAAGSWGRTLLVLAVYFAATIALATLTFHAIEQPGRRLFNRLASGRTLAVNPAKAGTQ